MFESNGIVFAYEPSNIFKRDSYDWRFGREPVLRRMKDGSLLCLVYSGGDREPSPDNVELAARSYDDGKTWSKPELLFSHDSRAVWGTELFTEGEQAIAFVQTFECDGFYSELRANMSFSSDSGKTWSEPQTLKGTPPNFSVRQGRVLSDGAWLFPVYWLESDGQFNWNSKKRTGFARPSWRFRSGVIRSEDKGGTFTLHGYLNPGEGRNAWEPDAIELSRKGHLLMLIRGDDGFLLRSESYDCGKTWSELELSEIPNPSTKFVMEKIDGQIVLLSNFSSGCDWSLRTRMEAWTSADDGLSWAKKTFIAEVKNPELNPGKVICYPHCFKDDAKRLLYVALDSVGEHHFLKIPYGDLLVK